MEVARMWLEEAAMHSGGAMNSLILSLTHSCTHPPTHSLTHSFTHSLTHPFIHPLTHSFTRLQKNIHALIYLLVLTHALDAVSMLFGTSRAKPARTRFMRETKTALSTSMLV